MELEGKVAIVTGASRGIGRELCVGLAGAGMKVIAAAKTVMAHPKLPGTLEETVAAVEAIGGEALAVKADLREEADIERVVAAALERFGRIDVLLNNAGALWWKPVLETPAKRFDLVMGVNVRASFLLSAAVARHMVERGGGGHIVMMSPPLDTRPHPGMAAYTVSKYGMTQVALSLAEELRPHGIGVNALWPATPIKSMATLYWGMGDPKTWREPSILVDATLAILAADPRTFTGRALIDEELLMERGVTDFRRYRCDPDTEPQRLAYDEIAKLLG